MVTVLRQFGDFGYFLWDFGVASASRPPPMGRVLTESYRIGVQSLPILLIVSTFVGTNLSLQGYNAFLPLGGQSLVGLFVGLAGVREMAPIMVGAMVAAKAGTEMASQIAVMRMREQIEALQLMSVDPHWYLVTPRLLGILLVLPALTMISIFTLILSGWAVAVGQLGLNGHSFLEQVANTTSTADLGWCVMKSFAFGLVICLVSCYYGFSAKAGPRGVGVATNAAVVTSAVVCAALNYLISSLAFG